MLVISFVQRWAHPWCDFCRECLFALKEGLPAGVSASRSPPVCTELTHVLFQECCIGCYDCNDCKELKAGDAIAIIRPTPRFPTTRGTVPPVYKPLYFCKCPPFPVRGPTDRFNTVLTPTL